MLFQELKITKMKKKESEKHFISSLVFGRQLVKLPQLETIRTYREKISEQEEQNPTTIRHLTTFKEQASHHLSRCRYYVGQHRSSFIISSMSFGSQNEIAFRAYAEGANRLNMVSLNGEGGEIKDMLGNIQKHAVNKLLLVGLA